MKININEPFTSNEIKEYKYSKNIFLSFFSVFLFIVFSGSLLFNYLNSANFYTNAIVIISILLAAKVIQSFDDLLEVSKEETEDILFYAKKNNDVKNYIKKINKMERKILKIEHSLLRTFFYNEVHNRSDKKKKEELYNY